ncbi:MAG: hypothetical protein JNM52_05305 [Betaproteobacteria bacterium]|nr:hypothetical protein [Betaproteobacteria bacterium]
MSHSRDDVVAAVEALFPGDGGAVLTALDAYGSAPYEGETHRVHLAIIKLCGGNREKLQQLVQAAKVDYRDILAWQQLGPLSDAEGEKMQHEARALLQKWGPRQGPQ